MHYILIPFQVGHLGEAYEEWVHQPIMGKEGPRFFHSSFLELFTRTAWWVIPLVWVPVASCFISNSIRIGIPTLQLPFLVILGIFVWTLTEYLLHRFLFHVKTQSYWLDTSLSLVICINFILSIISFSNVLNFALGEILYIIFSMVATISTPWIA